MSPDAAGKRWEVPPDQTRRKYVHVDTVLVVKPESPHKADKVVDV